VKIGILLERRGVVVPGLGEVPAHQALLPAVTVMTTPLRSTAA
jgi:hypothetical protein